MLFAVICTDKPGSLDVRLANRPDHVEFLKGLGDRLKLAGPFTGEDGDGMNGSLLVLEADSIAEARLIACEDPYAVAGLFDKTDIRPWKRVISNMGD